MSPLRPLRPYVNSSATVGLLRSAAALFAMHRFREAPFFVLDEIDAAMDNMNVSRLINFIRAQLETCQVLCISHKDTFYEAADSLVGVYRDRRDDCSKCLTVDLAAHA